MEFDTMLINANPVVYESLKFQRMEENEMDESVTDVFDELEIFDLIKNINDPEHPLTLEQLNVVQLKQITLNQNIITVEFTPTIPHCSMATLIGLCIRVRLLRCLPMRFRVFVRIYPGTHQTEESINKQLNDKERVAAALENDNLLEVVNQCLSKT